MAPKTILLEMHWQVIDNVFILLCLVACAGGICSPEKCGLMDVSYPFWIHNQTCGYPGFQINCSANGKDTPFLATRFGDFEILEIDYSRGYIMINSTSLKAMSCNRTDDAFMAFGVPERGPFTISDVNIFAVIGCKSMGSYTTNMWTERVSGRCESACLDHWNYSNGYRACKFPVPGKQKFINFTGGGQRFGDNCGFSTILDPDNFTLDEKKRRDFARFRYGLRLDWGVGHKSCSSAKETLDYTCAGRADCWDSTTGEGHFCTCPSYCEGDGYSYGMGCKYTGYRRIPPRVSSKLKDFFSILQNFFSNGYVIIVTASVSSFVVAALAASALFCCLRKRHKKHVLRKYFQQNGGIQLQQYIASRGGRNTIKIYSATELERASKNYSIDMKLGSGGYGTVFKAFLPDGTVGAIKKSKKISDAQQEDVEFINELIILSQINHRNVVKLVGCCLETQNPLLVYEFIPNGTLREHIQSKEGFTWEIRLRIAIETAEALAYLHSQPIFHRDVKSSNILLDNTHTPKVADFGISRLLNPDDTHLTTNVVGTMGYMDPEYFQSFQLTDKSDVYSFGVVLLELLTGLQPLSHERPTDECALGGLFLSRLNSNRLHEILDVSVTNEERGMQMKNMANLARECLHVEGRRRPSMKEVVEELLWIRGVARHTGLSQPTEERREERNEIQRQRERSEICEERNEMQRQRGTSERADVETYTLVLEGCVASMSFSIGMTIVFSKNLCGLHAYGVSKLNLNAKECTRPFWISQFHNVCLDGRFVVY